MFFFSFFFYEVVSTFTKESVARDGDCLMKDNSYGCLQRYLSGVYDIEFAYNKKVDVS